MCCGPSDHSRLGPHSRGKSLKEDKSLCLVMDNCLSVQTLETTNSLFSQGHFSLHNLFLDQTDSVPVLQAFRPGCTASSKLKAASMAFQGRLSLEQILSACHWKSHNIFALADSKIYHLGPIVMTQRIRN